MGRSMGWTIASMAVWLLAAGSASAADYRVGVGDHLEIKVYDEPDLTGEVVVDDACTVNVGLVGAVEACGLNTSELVKVLTARFEDGYLVKPVVAVKVVKHRSQKVDVLGEVGKRGPVYLEGRTTLLDVISLAGGPKADNVVQVQVVRADGSIDEYDLTRLAEAGPVYVSGGDAVTLAPGEVVYVEGEVKRPGVVTLQEGLTVTQALALSGGPEEFANLRRVFVRRPTGEKLRVNVNRVNRGTEDDVVLTRDDYLIVPRGAF